MSSPDPAAVPAPPPFSMQQTFLLSQPEATTLSLVRHGQQEHPASPVFAPADWVDPPLSGTGQRQAEAVGRAFAGEPVDVVVCSDLVRAHDTARAVASHHGLEPLVLPELREVATYRDLPDGVAPADVLSAPHWRGLQERWPDERRWDLIPFGETGEQLRLRVVSTVEGLLALHPGANVVVVSHGGVINAYLAHLLGIAQDMFFLPAHASVSRVRRLGDRRVLHSLNDRDHLQTGSELLTY